jgi:hypothetical protein
MRSILLASALAASLFAAASASAVTIANVSGSGALTFQNTGPGLLQADFALGSTQSVTLDLTVEAGDAGGITFDSFVDLLGPFGTNGITLALTNGATFSTIGSAVAAFSTASISGSGSGVAVNFSPREFASVVLGDIGSGGTDWVITPGAGDFSLTITAVPAPAALALFGLGLAGLAVSRRR